MTWGSRYPLGASAIDPKHVFYSLSYDRRYHNTTGKITYDPPMGTCLIYSDDRVYPSQVSR